MRVFLNRIVLLLLFIVAFTIKGFSQPPCSTILGQNPSSAIPVCGTTAFHQEGAASCDAGPLPMPNNGGCTDYTSDNSFWYKFHCYQTGTLGFVINGTMPGADYDWAVFDITGRNPADVLTDPSLQISLNLYGVNSPNPPFPNYPTGCTTAGVGNVHCENETNPFNEMPVITVGHDYLLMVTNYLSTGNEYFLDFGGGTAVITDPVIPSPNNTYGSCDNRKIIVKLNKKVKCSTLAADGSDFYITSGSTVYTPTSAISGSCSSNLDMDSLVLTLSAPLPGGTYQVKARNGTDGNTLLDYCDNSILVGDSITLVIDDVAVPDFTSNGLFCSNSDITFTDASTTTAGIIRWHWDMGDGNTFDFTNGNPFTHKYASSGSKTVTLTVTTGRNCMHSISKIVNINLSVAADFTNTPTCLPSGIVSFTNNSSIADGSPISYTWDFGDPASGPNNSSSITSPTHTYTSTGPFTVLLTATSINNCVSTVSKLITNVFAQPKSEFTYATEACINTAATFTSTADPLPGNSIVSYQWDFGDLTTGTGPTPNHVYTTPGTKTVTHWIVNSNGCHSDSVSHDIEIIVAPTADFSFSGATFCALKDITFTDASVPNIGTITNWHWDMGDGNIYDFPNGNPFTHQYTGSGPKTVTLTVTTDKGCMHSVTKTVNISVAPVPVFSSSPVCLPYESSLFINNTTITDGSPLAYSWDFGDPASGANNTSALPAPTHYFSTTGPYMVTLTATSNTSFCTASITLPVTNIYAQAHAPFVVLPKNCLGTATLFTSNADGSGNAIASYEWDFGDATTGTGAVVSHTYATPGLKTIKHWVVTDKNCFSDTATQTVYINRLPTVDFSFTAPGCNTRTVNFTDASAPNDGILSNWAWDFGDPLSPDNTSIFTSPSHAFALPGLYSVSLTVTTSEGCSNTVPLVKQVQIYERPQADFLEPKVCLDDIFAQFNDNSRINTGSVSHWEWDFGDPASGPVNNSSILRDPTHVYGAVGPYDVRLIVTSNNGCLDTITKPIFVNGTNPVADFSLLNTGNICATDLVSIKNLSSVTPGNITRIKINWDDTGTPGVFDTDNNPTTGKVYQHLYPDFQSPVSKTVTIRFRAYSGSGDVCVTDKLMPVTLHATPKIVFKPIPDTCFLATPFKITQASEPNSLPGGPGIYSGTGIINSDGTFDPALAGIGTHVITYTFVTSAGCTDTKTSTIRVLDTASANFIFSAPPACDGQPVSFTDRSVAPAGVTLFNTIWDFGDLTPWESHAPGSTFTHLFSKPGLYIVKMYNVSAYGCNSKPVSIPVLVSPTPVAAFDTKEKSVCLPDATINFVNNSSILGATPLVYTWDFGDGSLPTSAVAPSHTYTGTGPYTVKLIAKSDKGCIHQKDMPIDFIHPQPIAKSIADKKSVCLDEHLFLTDITDPLDGTTLTWHWDLGDGTMEGTPKVDHHYLDTGTYRISFYIINSHNCKSTVEERIFTVYPYPVVYAGPDQRVLEGAFVKLQPTVSGNDLQYLWTPADYLNNNRILQPVAQYIKDSITYKLTVTGRGGCPASDDVFIRVLKRPVIPNTFTPNNDGINDKWAIKYLDAYPNCFVQVFTRTGQRVFESRGIYKAWDGTRNGKPLPFDTYYYIIEPGNGQDHFSGFVTIVK